MYLVDLKTKTATRLELLDLSTFAKASVPSGSSLQAADLKYFDLTIDGLKITDSLSLANAEASVSQSVRLELRNYKVDDLRAPWDAMDTIFKTISAEKLRNGWRIDEAVSSKDILYVLVTGTVKADQASFNVGGQEGGPSATFKINVKGATVSVTVTSRSEISWTGASAPVLVRLYAFQAYLDNQTRRYHFQTINTDQQKEVGRELSASFRNK